VYKRRKEKRAQREEEREKAQIINMQRVKERELHPTMERERGQ